MSKKLVLFDVDHTLLDAGNSHKDAFVKAFKEVLNLDFDYSGWKFGGFTDLQIIHELMDRNNIERDPRKISRIIEVMVDEFKRENLEHAYLLEGAIEILKKLKTEKDVIIGLVTGNIEEIAYTKLKHLNIDEYFVLGGFGHKSTIRSELIRMAIYEAEKKIGKIEESDVFIIGDTINDIKAARDAGVKVIAVATGMFGFEELNEKNPDYLFTDLKNTDKVIDVIKNE
ncbi:MAG: HAD family hydrolase [Nanoarchaeota archaeon]|nr:HAD family hydrolase [Nanoarchaeota archaeon]